jgi:hypothetical protein
MYRPRGTEIRLKVGLDPRQRQRKERDKYMKEIEDAQIGPLEIKIPGGKLTDE